MAKPTEHTGWGLFAEKDFVVGEILFCLRLNETERSGILPWAETFEVLYDRSFTVVPDFVFCVSNIHPFWYVNHSCNANSGFVNWGYADDRIVPIVAYRNIRHGEEITIDYSLCTSSDDVGNDEDFWELAPCHCGSPNCRGTITGFDTLPVDIKLQAILPTVGPNGRVLAHILRDNPVLVETLQHTGNALLYMQYLDVLQQQLRLSEEFGGEVSALSAWIKQIRFILSRTLGFGLVQVHHYLRDLARDRS